MPQNSLWLQTVTLIKRNFKVKLRVKQASVQEILWPIYFVVLLAVLKSFAFKPKAYGSLSSSAFNTTIVMPPNSVVPYQFFVAPNVADAESLMTTVTTTILPGTSYQMFQTQGEMDAAYKNTSREERALAVGILFQNSVTNQYALRFPYSTFSSSFTDFFQGNCRLDDNNRSTSCAANKYSLLGFTTIQSAIDIAIAKTIDPNFDTVNISARVMPKDPTLSNTEAFMIIGPLYLVMALGPFVTFLLVFVVYEKEKKIKEGMKMMGLSDLAYWFSWGIVYAISLFVMSMIMTIIGYFGQLWRLSNFFLIFLFMFIYGLSIEMLGFMITPFFSKARTAGAVGGFLSIIMSLIFLAIQLTDSFPDGAIWALSLLSPTAFAFVMGKVFYFEVTGMGAQFSNLGEGPNPMYIGFVMMIVDIFLYFLLTLYLDSVVPSEYGQRKSLFFFLRPSYWFKERRGLSRDRMSRRSVTGGEAYSQTDFEPIAPEHVGNEAITFQGIRKVFQKKSIFGSSSKETVAIKKFTLDIYKGQITALLGHNGAGKTTLFNILTGFVPATSGSANVYGYDVTNTDDMDEIRKITGVCPQHDILLDYLSVIEHLEVFAGIKGYTGDEKTAEVNRVFDVIDLKDQKDTFAKKLSGGQKRKLSVGIAILGDPKILILDEPTAGMDPYSRRKLWDLLRSNQEDRVTLLTTHFMDEADILADRKAILTNGKLRCVGSSLFLKNRFGVGYHLGVVSKARDDERAITACVATNIQDAQLERSVGMEHAYTLPLSQVSSFPTLFSELDKRQDELNIQSYGVSMTTLEEVFLKIREDDDVEDEQEQNGTRERYDSVGYLNPAVAEEEVDGSMVAINLQNGTPTFDPGQSETAGKTDGGQVILQLMRRTLLINIRNPGYVIFAMILPIILEIVGTWLYTTSGSSSDSDDPTLYDITYQNNLNQFTGQNGDAQSVLYKGLTGSANASFVNNIPNGITMQQSTLTDQALLQTGFWPHSVGLDVALFSMTQAVYTTLYNTSYTRSLPAAINLFSNSITSFLNGSATNIVTYSKEWPQTDDQPSGDFNTGAFGASLMVSLAILLPTAFAAGNPVKEREQKVRTQLRVSGVQFFNYWIAYLLGDYIVYFVMCVVYIICIYAFGITGLNNGGATGALILLLLGWGVACLLTSYTGSFLFERFETVQASWPGIVQLASLIPYIVVSTLDMTLDVPNGTNTAMYLNIVFLILSPYYCGFSGIYYCFRIYLVSLATTGQPPASSKYFDWSEPMLPLSIIMVYVHIVLYSCLLLVADVRKHGGQLPCFKKKQVGSELSLSARNDDVDEVEDEDVSSEREKVALIGQGQAQSQQAPVVLMEGLRKEFRKRTSKSCQSCRKSKDDDEEETTKVAVRNLSMTVYPGEVVGLLGPNGAGKTTALNVLIADIGATKGRVSIAGEAITSSLAEVFKAMGYCPQSNPLWNSLTLQEHLEIYATIRGVPNSKIPSTVENFMEGLDIVEHRDKRAKALSGGTKRKLCFAISMLGNPQVVLLDEPSTGMDPKTKRFLWNTISSAFEGTNRGAILTTHYMEEADALCSRVGIMVLGQLRCIGSTQHLKGKFGQGYILEVKLDQQHHEEEDGEGGERIQTKTADLENFIKSLFPSIEEPEKFGNRWTYKIRKEDVTSLAKVFSSLEDAKDELGIEEYSFSQSTLEQVFLRFAKEQATNDEEEQQKATERKRDKKRRKK